MLWLVTIHFLSVLKIRRVKKTPCNVFLMFVLTFGAGGGAFLEDFLDLFGISSPSTALACLFTTKPDFLFLSDAFFFAFSAGKDWNQMIILFSEKSKLISTWAWGRRSPGTFVWLDKEDQVISRQCLFPFSRDFKQHQAEADEGT